MTRPLALAAALAFAAAPLAAQTPGARLPAAEHAHGGIHILTMLPDGSVGCDVATEAEATELRRQDATGGPVRLTVLPSLNRPGVGQFTIIIRATDQLLARPNALLAFRRAAARWERLIQNPVTTVIDLDYGPNRFNSGPFPTNVLASANSAQQFASATAGSAEIRAALAANQSDAPSLALINAIPTPTPSTLSGEAGTTPLGRGIAGLISLQVLGFRPAVLDPDPAVNPFGTIPNIGFNSAFAYDFNPNDGITPGQTDFEAVTAHEIGHTLGFTSAIGQSSVGNPVFTPWDLFRVRPQAVTPGESYTDGVGWEVTPRVLTPGPVSTDGVQVMFTGDAEYETSTARGDRTGGDGQQASHWRDDALRPPGPDRKIGIMDPTIGAGEQIEISPADIRALDLFGYVVNTTPSTASAALTIAGSPVNIDFLTPVVRASVPVGGGSLPVTLANTDTGTSQLDFAFEVVIDSVQSLNGATPTVSVTPETGSVPQGGTASLALNVTSAAGGAVVYGRLYLRSTDRRRAFADVPFQISVGSPNLAPASSPVAVMAPSGSVAPATVTVQNTGDAPVRFVRILEPAASEPGTARHPFAGDAAGAPARTPQAALAPGGAPDAPGAEARPVAQLNITGTTDLRLYDLAQLPSGDVLIVDGGRTTGATIYQTPADISAVTATYTSSGSLGGTVSGLAYNDRTGSLWVAIQETGLVREIALSGTDITLTGRLFSTGTQPYGMAYSPELDAFVMAAFDANEVYAFTATGTLLPGYPSLVDARAAAGSPTSTPGLSFTEGLLEVLLTPGRIIQTGQFGKTFTDASIQNIPSAYGLQRSRVDPNGTIYITTRTAGSTASIRTFDPPDLPASVGTRLEAATPLLASALVAPGGTATLDLLVDARNVAQGTETDELAFLTNAPTNRVVRFPVTISVGPVGVEGGPDAVVERLDVRPNPARGAATLALTLRDAADATVSVYNALGQRVAVLAARRALPAGTTVLPLATDGLASGVYVVRVEAGGAVLSHTLTVVR